MSVYFSKGKGWRYDFTRKEIRYTQAGFKTKAEAKRAEVRRREVIDRPRQQTQTQTDMAFLDLINRRLDHVQAYNSNRHYKDYVYLARRWTKKWGKLKCDEITIDMVQDYLLLRSKVSGYTANKDLRYLRATFNFGIKRKWISFNPTHDIKYFPIDKKIKYVPSQEDVSKVIMVADPDTKDYLYCIKESMGRMSEINQLTWSDVSFKERYVVLYTRKKQNGHRTPRKVPMTDRLYEILLRHYKNRDKEKPWVFWHRYWSPKKGTWVEGPYAERKKIMQTLCKKAGVKYFRYHALRHLGASMLDNVSINIGSIQRILGHENRKTTEIYLHSIGESERDTMRIFSELNQNFEKSLTPILTPDSADGFQVKENPKKRKVFSMG